MRNEHEVSSGQMGFLFAMHFGDPGDRAVWRDAMKPRMDRFRDRAAHERVNGFVRADCNARPIWPLNLRPVQLCLAERDPLINGHWKVS